MEEYKTIELGKLFNKTQLKEILAFINKNKWAELREYLNKSKKELKKKGILPDYLYYFLLSKFGNGQ